jgi:hypothetical protein
MYLILSYYDRIYGNVPAFCSWITSGERLQEPRLTYLLLPRLTYQ